MAVADNNTPEVAGGVVTSDNEVTKLAGLLSQADAGDDDDDVRNSDASNPDANDDAPERASGEDKDKLEPSSTAIEPPSSWDAEAKAKFKSLPAELQEFISAREVERDKGISTRLQEIAESRKRIDAQAEQVVQIRNAYEQRLIAQAKQLEDSIPEEFKAIRSPADLYAVSQKDPALAARFTAFQQQAAGVMHELAQINQHRSAEQQQRYSEFLSQEHAAISKAWPDFVDEKKGPQIRSELSAYAKEAGFTDAEVSQLADHRLVLLLRDAVEGRKARTALEKARAKADKPNLPKVAKPGQGDTSRNGLDRASLIAAARSGNTDKQAAALARLFES